MKDYILFIPPEELVDRQPREWTTKEAKVYFEWFISIKGYRIDYLLTTIDEKLTDNKEQDLTNIGEKISRLLFQYPFSKSEGTTPQITNQGLSLVADMSLLISTLIIKDNPQIEWKIVKRPKSDVAYNLPAMFNFPKIGHIELMRASIVNAKAILRGDKTYKIWLEMYSHLKKLLI